MTEPAIARRHLALHLRPPPIPDWTVPRPRLHGVLDEADAGALVLVTGPAGMGKTTLVRSWSEPREDSLAWVALDMTDGSRTQLWDLVLAALTAAGVPGLPDDIATDVNVLLADIAAGLGRLDAPITLVIDDAHEIPNPDDREEILLLARWHVPNLRIVVTSREETSLRIQRMLLAGTAAHITAGELAFDRTDTAALFALAGLEVDDVQIAAILERTGGWPAGIGLTLLGLKNRGPAGAGGGAAMSDYLFQEVLARLDPDDLEFLLATSILDEVCGDLANALTGDTGGGHRLENLRSRGFPLVVTDEREWYRPHPPLLAEHLRTELQHRRSAEEIADLHAKAARWLSVHERPIDALDHAIAAQATGLAVEIVEQHYFALLTSNRLHLVAPLLESNPDGLAQESPIIGIAVAYAALRERDVETADRWLAVAHRAVAPTPGLQRRTTVAHLITLLRRASVTGELDATHALTDEILVELQGESLELTEARALRSVMVMNRIAEDLWHGTVDDPVRLVEAAVDEGAGTALISTVAGALLGRVHLHAGRLDAAEAHALELLEQAEGSWETHEVVWTAHAVLAEVALRRSDLGEVAERLAQTPDGPMPGHPLAEFELLCSRARLLRRVGRPLDAVYELDRAEEILDGMVNAKRPRAQVDGLRALSLLAAGQPEEAIARVGPVDGEPKRALALAVIHQHLGDSETARDLVAPWLDQPIDAADLVVARLIAALGTPGPDGIALLDQALELAAPGRMRLPFDALASDELTALLRRRPARSMPYDPFAAELLHEPTSERPVPVATDGPREELSDRELDVLRFLPTSLTNQEIADRLCVSLNTVKTHLKHVYAKLDVTSREDAVARSRQQGLLPGRL